MKITFFRQLLVAALCAIAPALAAQVITTSPAIVQTNSTNIVITYHADRGNKGLINQPSTAKIYAHTGVITNLSTSPSDWKYAPTWGDNSAKYQMTYAGPNLWTLTIPSINEYYGITNPAEIVEKLAFVFRNADNSKEGKGDGGSDIFVNVAPAGFQMSLTSTAENGVVMDGRTVTITASATSTCDMALYLGSTSTAPLKSAQGVTSLSVDKTFDTQGTYTIIATAKNASGQTLTEELNITRIVTAQEQAYPGGTPKPGPVANSDGSVTFCFPTVKDRTKSMIIVPSWTGYTITEECVMKKHTVGNNVYFWTTMTGIDPAADNIYYFLADGSTKVGDPYARLVLDPWNDKYISSDVFPNLPVYPTQQVQNVPLAVYKPVLDQYNWRVKNFKGVKQNDLLIYELLIRDFTGTEGQANGEGTVEGVISKLDYLRDLGVNAIELLPIMEFNGNLSWGYNTNFYFAPDKAYGTPTDYRRLIDECHLRGMAVILDIVLNQSDGLHPWYQLYPIASNPFYNGSAPHAYSVLNDWNQDCELVQKQWEDCLKYWITEYKVDGYRFDLVKGLGDNSSYGNTYNPTTNTFGVPSDANTNRYNATRVARMKKLHDAIRTVKTDAYFINEDLAGAQEENEMATDGEINWANINNSSCQFAMGYNSDAALNRFYAPLDSRTWGSTVSYAESHDEERMAYKQRLYGTQGVRGNVAMMMRRLGSVAAQMILTPGAHMIWQFQEFGADQTTKNSDGSNNTDNKRVIWSYLDNADRAGLKENYSQLLGIRADSPELFDNSATTTTVSLGGWDAGRTITLKAANGKELYVFINPTVGSNVIFSAPVNLSAGNYHLVAASYGVTPTLNGSSVTLPAGAFAVYGTINVSGIDEATLDAPAAPMIYTIGNSIVVEGYESNQFEVYNLAGVKVNPDAVVPGIYIVTVDGYTTKLAVR